MSLFQAESKIKLVAVLTLLKFWSEFGLKTFSSVSHL